MSIDPESTFFRLLIVGGLVLLLVVGFGICAGIVYLTQFPGWRA